MGYVYRFRLEVFCGNVRVQYMLPFGGSGTHPADTVYYGCGSDGQPDGICSDANKDDCWCQLFQGPLSGVDPSPTEGAGMVGIYMGGHYRYNSITSWDNKIDNVRVSRFDGGCGEVCDPWLEDWTTVRTDTVPFKFLYEGALFDYSAGRNMTPAADRGKIDVATEAPASLSPYNHSLDGNAYCNGWNLLQDLPPPTATGGNIGDAGLFLEPMHTAVGYDHDPVNPAFDNIGFLEFDDTSPNYDPLPMVADGSTPINASLLEAFDWYVEQRTVGDWVTDPYEGCRDWYVVLITDGEEACEFEGCTPGTEGCNQQLDGTWKRFDYDRVCDTDQGAYKFGNAEAVAGVPSVPIYTIGFSESVGPDSPLSCIADETGGLFLPTNDPSDLYEALNAVFYFVQGEKRSFMPFKVSPPPSGTGGLNPARDYLAVYPLFQPKQGQTLWAGNLYGFKLNSDQPLLPTVNDCNLDLSAAVWDAAAALRQQLDDHTEANPQRFVFMGSTLSGSWARADLREIPYDENLRNEFKLLIDPAGLRGLDDIEVQQVANFVRYIYQDNDSTIGNEGPPAKARPEGYPVFGEFYHSQPVVVNPPNNPTFFYDFGYAAAGERGAHDYTSFIDKHRKRRRLTLSGSNDGMLHAFDAGVWDRDRDDNDLNSDTYNEIHDLGNGTELFAWVPRAVMDNLYLITAGDNLPHSEPLYMVDGPITVSDAFIDYDGDNDREWRTVALTSMRRGGRGIVALDITQPDPLGSAPDYVPTNGKFAGCRDGNTPKCDGEFPKVLWEFSDTTDEDLQATDPGKCPAGYTPEQCRPYQDLGWTWSKPAIARVPIYNSSNEQQPDDKFVAFFGGGWDANDTNVKNDAGTPGDDSDDFWANKTGNFIYGVDLADGSVVVKIPLVVDVPGGVTALDSNNDGFHDRIYFADTDGSVWRIQYPDPTDSDATGPEVGDDTDGLPGVLTRIFDFRDSFPDRQEFFTRPVPVAAIFDGSGYTWALALGSGDRSELDRTDTGVDHFFFLIDAGDGNTRTASELWEVGFADLTGGFDCNDNYLVPPYYGWYLSLRETEKVMFDATVIDGWVQFPTFDPTATQAVHNVPNQCGEGPETEGDPVDLSDVCYASGLGRTYKLWYQCGLGDYKDHTDIITGTEDYSIGDSIYVSHTTSQPTDGPEGPQDVDENIVRRGHTTTNWRQE
jgi:hypothetical protein